MSRRARPEAGGKEKLARLLEREEAVRQGGIRLVAGVDEAGVGPLAGPLVAAAVVFEPGSSVPGVDDSKRVSAARRAILARAIRAACSAYALGIVEAWEVDRLNVYRGALEAMRRAVVGLAVRPDYIFVDARTIPGIDIPQEPIVGGDGTCHAIAAASILAKVARDELMEAYDAVFPGYGFASHKGYPTPAHLEALGRLGACPIHRRSFSPVRRLFEEALFSGSD
jgi:ribonuclease HII